MKNASSFAEATEDKECRMKERTRKGLCPQITHPPSLRKEELRRTRMNADEELFFSLTAC
jgi:hypothetical protein